MRKASAPNPRNSSGGPRFSKLGGLENHIKSTSRREVLAAGMLGGPAVQVTGGGGPWPSQPATRERRRPGV
jgi:hypothetical protein